MFQTIHSHIGIWQAKKSSIFDCRPEMLLQPSTATRSMHPMKIARLLLTALLLSLLPTLFAQAPAANSATTAANPAMKSWLIRLIPPRPTFDKDATPAELALMEQHFAYWKDLNEKGVCLFGGPVLDPRGVYGILVVRAQSEDDARALGSGDPSVKAGVNKIEVAEIRVAFVPVPRS
jgi:uncharacterized protein YciI